MSGMVANVGVAVWNRVSSSLRIQQLFPLPVSVADYHSVTRHNVDGVAVLVK